MKINSRLVIAIVSLLIILLSQSYNATAKEVFGQVLIEGDTVNVIFDIPVNIFSKQPSIEKMQYGISYKDASAEYNWLKPKDADEIRFTYKEEAYRMLTRTFLSGIKKRTVFLLLRVEGPLKMFLYYGLNVVQLAPSNSMVPLTPANNSFRNESPMSPFSQYSAANVVFQKGEEEPKRPGDTSFRKSMVKYFADCPELVGKINNKTFQKDDMLDIANFYNNNCN